MVLVSTRRTEVHVYTHLDDDGARLAFDRVVGRADPKALRCDPRWLRAVCRGLQHRPYFLAAKQEAETVGILPLALVESRLFGRFLVSLPYLNSAGVVAENADAAGALVDRAVELADELDVRYLELRHEKKLIHQALTHQMTSKVLMRLTLPASVQELRDQLRSKVRNKVRKGERQGFTVHWGGLDLLPDFYAVFSRNMRDLGTPVYGRRLFRAILTQLSDSAELCVVRAGRRPIAAALLVHGPGVTEVPSASSLRQYNSSNVNDMMYWQLLCRAIERKQRVFDFGRSTLDGNTFVFKKKWGAQPEPSVWQYYVRKGSVGEMRIESGRYDRMIEIWRRLPVWLTRLIGPVIVRGIP